MVLVWWFLILIRIRICYYLSFQDRKSFFVPNAQWSMWVCSTVLRIGCFLLRSDACFLPIISSPSQNIVFVVPEVFPAPSSHAVQIKLRNVFLFNPLASLAALCFWTSLHFHYFWENLQLTSSFSRDLRKINSEKSSDISAHSISDSSCVDFEERSICERLSLIFRMTFPVAACRDTFSAPAATWDTVRSDNETEGNDKKEHALQGHAPTAASMLLTGQEMETAEAWSTHTPGGQSEGTRLTSVCNVALTAPTKSSDSLRQHTTNHQITSDRKTSLITWSGWQSSRELTLVWCQGLDHCFRHFLCDEALSDVRVKRVFPFLQQNEMNSFSLTLKSTISKILHLRTDLTFMGDCKTSPGSLSGLLFSHLSLNRSQNKSTSLSHEVILE